MNPIHKIEGRIKGLESLLRMSMRIGETNYMRSIRGDIEGLQRELKILRVQQSKLNENQD
jgi:hypothetical protein